VPILTAKGLRHAYGTRQVLVDAALSIERRERIGLVGRNGSGKTTLARILAGFEDPDGGEVVREYGVRVRYLEQEPRFAEGVSAVEAVLGGLDAWQQAIDDHRRFSAAIEAKTGDLESLLLQQADAGTRVEDLGGWEKRHEAEAFLDHVGIENVEAPVSTMSGGERRRVALARLLVAAPDLAVLDEPTNHLDVAAIEWLENWVVERFRGALLVVTHDRYMLDRIVTRTLEVDAGRVHSYAGGWATYLAAKAERMAHAERVEANRQNFLRRELEWLRRNPKARGTKQKARIDRVETVRDAAGPEEHRRTSIELSNTRSGRTLLDADGISVDVAGRRLVTDLTLNLMAGERIGILGPNGCGKTSLLRVLTREVEPSDGRIAHGKNTRIAYLDQARSGLKDDEKVFDAVAEGRGRISLGGNEMDVRTYLERFLFSTREQQQRLGTLSGGERARVALARTLREDANLIVLDEPTNDLDATTMAAFEEALLEYAGAVLLVTHDRWLLDRVCTSVLVFEGPRVTRYPGGYSDYLSLRPPPERGESKTTPAAPAAEPKARPRRLTYAEKIELEGLLEKVDEAERNVATLEAELGAPGFFERTDAARRAFFEQLEASKAEAEKLAHRWAELEELRQP
jgi:ATP-binding cassette subfamily F protein uup